MNCGLYVGRCASTNRRSLSGSSDERGQVHAAAVGDSRLTLEQSRPGQNGLHQFLAAGRQVADASGRTNPSGEIPGWNDLFCCLTSAAPATGIPNRIAPDMHIGHANLEPRANPGA